MSHETLRTLVHDDATLDEPPFVLSPAAAVATARRRLRRRRWAAGATATALAAVAAVAVPLGMAGMHDVARSGPEGRVTTSTAHALAEYDARLMPALIEARVAQAVGTDIPASATSRVTAQDSQGVDLPQRYFSRASGWTATYGWGPAGHTFDVVLTHSRSEAEGDPQTYCREGLATGYDLSCTARRTQRGEVVITSLAAIRVSRDRAGVQRYGVEDWTKVDPDRLWFERTVQDRRGGVYVTAAHETVHAPTPDAALRRMRIGTDAMEQIVSAPDLVFPQPPIDPRSGCPFVLAHNVTCSKAD